MVCHVLSTCGHDLSKCFIQYVNENEARIRTRTTETFDSRFAVINSLSRQAAGIATAVAIENYPYKKILERVLQLTVRLLTSTCRIITSKSDSLTQSPGSRAYSRCNLSDTRFQLVKSEETTMPAEGSSLPLVGYEDTISIAQERTSCISGYFAGTLLPTYQQSFLKILGIFGQQQDALLSLRLDPLADFFLSWGEGAELYEGENAQTETFFGSCTGSTVEDLARCVQNLPGFSTCTVQNVWEWLMGRNFYKVKRL